MRAQSLINGSPCGRKGRYIRILMGDLCLAWDDSNSDMLVVVENRAKHRGRKKENPFGNGMNINRNQP